MLIRLKPKFSYYNRFGRDIWGLCKFIYGYDDRRGRIFYLRFVKRRENFLKKFKRYVFRIDIIEKKVKFRRYPYRFVSIRLLRLYYIYIKDHQFRLLATKTKKKFGGFEPNYCHFLESRLMHYVHRVGYFLNIFHIMRYIEMFGVQVGKKFISSFRFLVPKTAWVFTATLDCFRRSFLPRVRRRLFHFNWPRYFFISHFFCWTFMWRLPLRLDLAFPIDLDIFRITGFY